MTAPLTADPTPDLGVADYYNRQPKRATSRLVALAPHVLLLARCEGAPETARYFEERLGSKVTEKMIKTIKSKVARGTLLVTKEELEEAALSHPITAARLGREPSLCDPQHYRAAITPEADEVEEAPAKKTAKKAAKETPTKKAKNRATKAHAKETVQEIVKVPASDPPDQKTEQPARVEDQPGDSLNDADSHTEVPKEDADEDTSDDFLRELDADFKKAGLPIN